MRNLSVSSRLRQGTDTLPDKFTRTCKKFLTDIGTVHDKLKTESLKQTDLQVLKGWLKLAAQVKNIDEFVKQTHLQAEV